MTEKSKKPLFIKHYNLSMKLVCLIILCSATFAFIASGVQLFYSYKRDIKKIHQSIVFIKDSYIPSLSLSLFTLNLKQAKEQLDGMIKLEGVQSATLKVTDTTPSITVEAGDKDKKGDSIETFELTYQALPNQLVNVGTLKVSISHQEIWDRMIQTGFIILVTNGVKTTLVTLGMTIIFYFLVIRHLYQIANYTRSLDRSQLESPLMLKRTELLSAWKDEIDFVGNSIDDMRERLRREMLNRNQLETSLIEARDRAEASNRAKSHFIANIGHELRTPLNAIIGYIELTKDTLGDGDQRQQRSFLDRSLNSSHKLLNIINELLDLTISENRKVTISKRPVDIEFLLSSVLQAHDELITSKFLKVEQDFSSLGQVHADPARLRQIFSNLLENAVKFSHPNGVIKLSSRTIGNKVEFRVEDHGIGITQSQQKVIFMPFHQVEEGFTRNHGGIGLGLALTKMLVELHGGGIKVESTPGKGSKFTFWLPLLSSPPKPLQASDRPIKCLVIDHDPKNQTELKNALQNMSISPLTATKAMQALELAKKEKPDLIFLDIGLPDMNFQEIVTRIRCLTPEKQPTLIAIVTATDNLDVSIFRSLGFTDCMTKPFDQAKVRHTVEALVHAENSAIST